ncbi:MAG TPA: NADH:ubiquinone reductase (Na(+)-transporting) subunit E [Clostridiales bacterium]|nr:NADH:ubiquinone reductase (Na(+)-transporting) subunit E [Clostridiales bacterium]
MEISPFLIFFASIFTSNILLTNFLGMCSYLSISKDLKSALGLGEAVIFVMSVTSVLNYLVYKYILIPFDLDYLRFIIFIIVIAAFVQLVEMILERFMPRLYYTLGIFLPLITVNCAILGVALFLVIREYNLLQSLAYGAGGGIGWTLAILALAGIRQKVDESKVPKGLQGPGFAMIVTGIMALAFIGFSGIISIQ